MTNPRFGVAAEPRAVPAIFDPFVVDQGMLGPASSGSGSSATDDLGIGLVADDHVFAVNEPIGNRRGSSTRLRAIEGSFANVVSLRMART